MSTNISVESVLPGVRESRGMFTTFPYTANLVPVTKTASVTLTSAEVEQGYIAVTSATAVSLTMPTGTLLGAQLGATQGYVFDLIIDNTASSSSGLVTMVDGTNGVQADYANQITASTVSGAAAPSLPKVITVGATGTGVYRLIFSSATAYTYNRIA